MKALFEESYPNIAHFVTAIGSIEIGYDEDSPLTSFIRAVDTSGLVWEGRDRYPSIEEALQDLEKGLEEWMLEIGIF